MAGTPGATGRAGVPSAPGERGRRGWWFPAEAARSREPGRQGRAPDPGSPVCCEWGIEEFSKTHRVGAGVLQVSAPRLSCLPGLPRSCSNAQIHGSGQLVPAEAAEQGLSRCLFPVGSFPCETRPRSVADATPAWPTPARPPGDCGREPGLRWALAGGTDGEASRRARAPLSCTVHNRSLPHRPPLLLRPASLISVVSGCRSPVPRPRGGSVAFGALCRDQQRGAVCDQPGPSDGSEGSLLPVLLTHRNCGGIAARTPRV